MLIKSECENCHGHLEFEEAGIGQTIMCPHCGNSTRLKAPVKRKSKRSKAHPKIDPKWGEWDELTAEQKEIAQIEQEFIIDIGDWKEFYPWLTWKRVQEAARHLDATHPGWRDAKNRIELNAETILKLHPELAAKRSKKAPTRTRAQGCLVALVLISSFFLLLLAAIRLL